MATDLAVRATGLTKFYGEGDTEVRALGGVTHRLTTPVDHPPQTARDNVPGHHF